MCIGLLNWHFQCGHAEPFRIGIQCNSAMRTGIECSRSQCSRVEKQIISPPLCVTCFRKTEEEICEEADKWLRELNWYLDIVKREFEESELSKELNFLYVDLLEEALEWRDENRTELALKLAAFRKSQGVWGDG